MDGWTYWTHWTLVGSFPRLLIIYFVTETASLSLSYHFFNLFNILSPTWLTLNSATAQKKWEEEKSKSIRSHAVPPVTFHIHTILYYDRVLVFLISDGGE